MKTILLLVLSSYMSHAAPLDLSKAEEFQFIHCVSEAKKGKSKHYVFDRRIETPALYFQSAAKDLKAVELSNLQLQDSDLVSTLEPGDDVTWFSKKTGQRFKFAIADDAGYLMKGLVVEHGFKTNLSCTDITQEK